MDQVVGSVERKPAPLAFTDNVSRLLRSSGVPFMVTGASGWLGRAILEMCETLLGDQFVKSVSAFTSTGKIISLRSGAKIYAEPLANLKTAKISNAVIFHCAFLTREQTDIGHDIYIQKNRDITAALAAFILEHGCRGLFLPSSGAVYRADRSIETDLLANPYAVLKFEDECIFGDLASLKNFPASIMRIFNLSGPFINKLESYALASIIRDATCRGVIDLRAGFAVVRSYAYVQDVVNVGLQTLLHNAVVKPMDTCGEQEIELGELAARVLRILDMPNIKIRRPILNPASENRYVGDKTAYFSIADKFGIRLKNLDEQIKSTIDYLTRRDFA